MNQIEKKQEYQLLLQQLEALLESEHDMICCMANTSAFLYSSLQHVNWVGFYRYQQNELILGPFQGKVACMHIPIGKGVCGSCANTLTTQRVQDVHACKNHIVCDAASKSEIVIPLLINQQLIAVLDIDSDIKNRFDEIDQYYLEQMVSILCQKIKI